MLILSLSIYLPIYLFLSLSLFVSCVIPIAWRTFLLGDLSHHHDQLSFYNLTDFSFQGDYMYICTIELFPHILDKVHHTFNVELICRLSGYNSYIDITLSLCHVYWQGKLSKDFNFFYGSIALLRYLHSQLWERMICKSVIQVFFQHNCIWLIQYTNSC